MNVPGRKLFRLDPNEVVAEPQESSDPPDGRPIAPETVYARGVADLEVLAELLPGRGFMFGPKPSSIDAGIYGFTANIVFYDIDTPLKDFLLLRPNLVAHCRSVHALLEG
jgi:Glutathione S-transferase, C-terminal domain